MLTKNDLSQIKTVVQETIHPEIKALKQDIKSLETRLTGDIKNLKVNMKNLETRLTDDMENMEVKLIERIDDAQMEIITTVDKHKADKEDVKTLGKRVDRLEDNAGLPTLRRSINPTVCHATTYLT